jgi:hypothetical protein
MSTRLKKYSEEDLRTALLMLWVVRVRMTDEELISEGYTKTSKIFTDIIKSISKEK